MAEPLLLPAKDAFRELGIGRDSGYQLIRNGRLRAMSVNRRLLVPRSELEAFVQRELEQAIGPNGDDATQVRNGNDPRL